MPWQRGKSMISRVSGPHGLRERFALAEGEPPEPGNLPSGCRFRTRCPRAEPRCADAVPPLVEHVAGQADACLLSPGG